MTAKLYVGKKVRVRWTDGAWYPAVIERQVNDDEWLVRWDPLDPNLPPTHIADENDIR